MVKHLARAGYASAPCRRRNQPDLRASDADRDAASERLRVAAMEGRLDPAELDERMSAAYAARWCSELRELTADVTPVPALPPQPAGRPTFVRPAARYNGLAIASVAVGLLWMWWIGSVLAVVFGHVALKQIASPRAASPAAGSRSRASCSATSGSRRCWARSSPWLWADAAGSPRTRVDPSQSRRHPAAMAPARTTEWRVIGSQAEQAAARPDVLVAELAARVWGALAR